MALARFIAAAFSPFRILSFRSASTDPPNPAHALGRRGEALAARHLRRNGYKVLYRNYKTPHGGEVDLVCRDKARRELVFIEVKTRTRSDFGRPADAVTPDKQRLIARGAMAWLRLLDNPDLIFRFDIVEVIVDPAAPRKPEITIIENAFQLPEPLRW
jgi:putative endonuclease